jgi:hypothetical protein
MAAPTDDRFAAVESQLARLAAAQEQTATQLAAFTAAAEQRFAAVETRLDGVEHRLTGVEERLGGVEDRLGRLEEQVAVFAAATEKRLAAVEAVLDQHTAILDQHTATLDQHTAMLNQHTVQLGTLTGWGWEERVRDHATSYLGQIARRLRVLSAPELERQLDAAEAAGTIADDEADDVRRADLVCSGRDPESHEHVMLVVEISARLDARDVARALSRAGIVARFAGRAVPVIVGQRIDRETAALADASGVRQIIAAAED